MNFISLLESANASGYSWLHIDQAICLPFYDTGESRYAYPSFVRMVVNQDWSFHLSTLGVEPKGIVVCRREPILKEGEFRSEGEQGIYQGPVEQASVKQLAAQKWDIISIEKWCMPAPEVLREDPMKKGACVLSFFKGNDLLGISELNHWLLPTRKDMCDMTLSAGEMVALKPCDE